MQFFHENFSSLFGTHNPLFTDPYLCTQLTANPLASLFTCSVQPISFDSNRVILLGDASHAILPFYGQGLNAGFEDLRLLFSKTNESSDLQEFLQNRIQDTEAIASFARENYQEMRERVLNPLFRLKCRFWLALSLAVPLFKSRYEMIAFTSIPYSQIRRRERLQQCMLLGISILLLLLPLLLFLRYQ